MNIEQFNQWFAQTQFDARQRVRVYKQLADMLTNNVRIEQLLQELYDRASKKGEKPNEAAALMFDAWRLGVKRGSRLADSMGDWIPPTDRMIILAGEESGNLPGALRSLVRVTEASRKIKSAATFGMLYPIGLMLAMAAYLWMFGTQVIPQFTSMFPLSKFSPTARAFFTFAQTTVSWGPWIALTAVAVVVGVAYSLPRLTGPIRIVLDRFPPYSTYRLIVGTGFLFALAEMLNANIRVKQALTDIADLSTPYLQERLDAYITSLAAGGHVGAALETSGFNFPDKEIVEDLNLYATLGGNVSDALNSVSDTWITEGVARVEAQIGVLKSIAMLCVIGLLMFIVAGFFAAQTDISNLARAVR